MKAHALHLVLLLASAADDGWLAYRFAPTVQVAERPRRVLGVFTAPGCPPCEANVRDWDRTARENGVDVKYYVRKDWTLPEWVPERHRMFPCLMTLDTIGPNGGSMYYYANGRMGWDQVKQFLDTHPVATKGP